MTKKILFSAITFFLVLSLVAIIFIGVEFYYRTLSERPASTSNYHLSSALIAQAVSDHAVDYPTHVPIHLPVGTFSARPYPPTDPLKKVTWPKGYYQYDRQVGPVPAKDSAYQVSETASDGHLIYDVKYTVDHFGRRLVPQKDIQNRKKSLLFLGCSFTYGEGLGDTDTLSAQVAKREKSHHVYTYAFHGWGPTNILRRVSKKEFPQEVSEREGVGIYVFIDSHLARVIGNLSLFRAVPNWRANIPYYYLDSNNELRSDKMISSAKPWESWWYGILAKSAFLNYYDVDIPPQFNEGHFKLLVSIVKKMKDTLKEQIGIKQFYVLVFPGSRLAQPLIHELDLAGISSIDYSAVDLMKYVKAPSLGADAHPSAEAQRFIAQQLVTDLNLH